MIMWIQGCRCVGEMRMDKKANIPLIHAFAVCECHGKMVKGEKLLFIKVLLVTSHIEF